MNCRFCDKEIHRVPADDQYVRNIDSLVSDAWGDHIYLVCNPERRNYMERQFHQPPLGLSDDEVLVGLQSIISNLNS